MPRLSDTMEEGTVVKWWKRPGDPVSRGDVLAEIETDKATMDLEAYEGGVVEQLVVEEGSTVPIGAIIAVIAHAGAPAEPSGPPSGATPLAEPASPGMQRPVVALPAGHAPPAGYPSGNTPPAEPAGQLAGGGPGVVESAAQPAAGRLAPPAGSAPVAHLARSSPLARRLARRSGLDIASIRGSGPGGRVVRADVEAAVARAAGTPEQRERGPVMPAAADQAAPGAPADQAAPGAPADQAAPGAPAVQAAPGAAAAGRLAPVAPGSISGLLADVEELPLSTIRRVTAERLAKSLEAPHFYLTDVVDAERLLALRAEIVTASSAESTKVTVTDLLIKACAKALRAHPEVNSSWGGDRIFRHLRVHVGIAVAVPEGLVVPVVKDADRKSLAEVSAEAHALAAKAREGKLSLDDISGGTFTISNLGMFGVDHFTAVINPPQAAILAVGVAKPEPVVREGALAVSTLMRVALSIDHRVLDGASAARFLTDLRVLLENPLRILL